MIDYGEIQEIENCKSSFLPEYIQRNIVELNLAESDEESDEEIEDDMDRDYSHMEAARLGRLETKMQIIYHKLTNFKQFQLCYQFIIAQVADKASFGEGPVSARRLDINQRI